MCWAVPPIPSVGLDADADLFTSQMDAGKLFGAYPKMNRLDYDKYNLAVRPRHTFKKGAFYSDITVPLSLFLLDKADRLKGEKRMGRKYLFFTPQATVRYRLDKFWMAVLSYLIGNYKVGHREKLYDGGNKRNHVIVTANVAKYIDPLKANVRITGNYNQMKFSQYQQEVVHRVTARSYNVGGRMDIKMGRKNSAIVNMEYFGNKIKSGVYKSDPIGQWKLKGGWSFFPNQMWQLSADANYSYNEIQDSQYAALFLLNAEAKYKQPRWELSLSAKNLLDNDEYDILTYDGVNTSFSHYRLHGREIVVAFRVKL